MFAIDHVVVWTPERDAALAALSAATGLPILDGYAPGGSLVARGVRFANGAFLDVHGALADGPVFLALSGRVTEAEELAARLGWRARVGAGPDEPWDLLSFRKEQGLLSQLFVLDYRPEQVTGSPEFNRGLYHLPPTGGPSLARVWIAAADTARAWRDLAALGFSDGGEVRSAAAPFAGRLYRGSRGDVVVCAGEDGVVRLDVATEGSLVEVALGSKLRAVVGWDRAA